MKITLPKLFATRPRTAPADQLVEQRGAAQAALEAAERAEQLAQDAFDADGSEATEAALADARAAVARAELHAARADRLVAAAERQAAEAVCARLQAELARLESQLSPMAKARRRRELEDEHSLLLLRVVEVRHAQQALECTFRAQECERARMCDALGLPAPRPDLTPAVASPMVVVEQLEKYARTLAPQDERRRFVAELIDQLAPGRAFYVHRLAAAE
ncbi:MAG: hypothetical protein RLZZ450_3095 [Pseudomonadota bacterium]|jgi:hypothetical protein